MTLKRTLIATTLCISFLSAAHAGQRELKDYSQQVKATAEKFAEMGKAAKGNKEVVLRNDTFKSITSQFGLTPTESGRIAQAVADGKTEVAQALYAADAAKKLSAQGNKDVNGLDASIAGIVKVSAVSGKGSASTLTPAERSDVQAALKRQTEITTDMMTYSKSEIESHSKVMGEADRIYTESSSSGKMMSGEEAFLQAIIVVHKIPAGPEQKAKAMEIIRKLKDCV